jgi:hypothetical protein
VIGAGQSDERALARVEETLARVYALAKAEGLSTHAAAERLAREAIVAMK